MTTRNSKIDYLTTLIRDLKPEDRQKALDMLSEGELSVVEDEPRNKISDINYQDYGLLESQFAVVQIYFQNGFNRVQAYLSVHPNAEYQTALKESHRMFLNPTIREFVKVVMNHIGMTNDEIERRLEGFLVYSPIDFFDVTIKANGGSDLVFNPAKAPPGAWSIVKGIKPSRYGLEVQFIDPLKAYDIFTKIRGMQKKVQIHGKLSELADEHDIQQDQLARLIEQRTIEIKAIASNGGIELIDDGQ